MITLLTVLHVIVGIFLILIVLLQRGKGASMGAAFGGSSQTLFGSRGPQSFLGKLTTVVALEFLLTSLTLPIYPSKGPTTTLKQYQDNFQFFPSVFHQGMPLQYICPLPSQ